MSKIKMRCITCGKWFQSANAREVTCPDCTQKARKEKLAAKNPPTMHSRPSSPMGPVSNRQAPPPPKPKPAQRGTNQWLDSLDDIKVSQPEQPPQQRPKAPPSPGIRDTRNKPVWPSPYGQQGGHSGYRQERGPAHYREQGNYREHPYYREPSHYREMGNRGPSGYRDNFQRGPGGYRHPMGGYPASGGYRQDRGPAMPGPRQRPPMEGGFGRGPRPNNRFSRPVPPRQGAPRQGMKAKGPRPNSQPKVQKEKTPPPQPFIPTPEQIARVEARYLELANPAEFDGIRTQISRETGVPKKAVKKIIKDLRERQQIPSWWEVQTYKGSAEELERIKDKYLPLLPVPPVGVHKLIAQQLSLKPGVVYQAIKAIRLEMNLPQYNDPSLHTEFDPKQYALEQQQALRQQASQQEESEEKQGVNSATAQSTEA
ncbi:hypothetical protein EI42_04285 [Thermosporothrix hazakensis]|uniref:Uncharacterized protein n=2 Tax=Thermosporothrix TaxID=768650 RepID=A0A326UBQ4_THEHA|nr:hypothetical protein [Thermosporothrix hazakensis]PZW25441.1 hypothetical protein EI42_04285 [Thermosporothrix hazakensis]